MPILQNALAITGLYDGKLLLRHSDQAIEWPENPDRQL